MCRASMRWCAIQGFDVHPRGELIVAGARGCIGTRFRVQGRLPDVGLDCVGVVVAAVKAAGVQVADAVEYSLRGEQAGVLDRALTGLVRVETAAAGDVLVVEPSAACRHLAVVTGNGTVIHAHAGLRRVVEGPVNPDWRVIGAWRLPED